ncbi:hypothetical protein MBLNU230_g2555t1 [Neophaeotheca triangularis]
MERHGYFVAENTHKIITHQFTLGLRQRFEKSGVTHTSHVLHRKVFNTIDPCNLETIMKTNFEDYTIIPARRKLIRVLFGEGIFASGGDNWRHSRVLVSAAGLRSAFDVDKFEKHVQVMLTELKSRHGQPFEFRELIFRYTFNLAADILLDLPSEELDTQRQFARDFTFLGKMARFLTIFVNQIPFLAELSYGRGFKWAQRRVFDRVDQRIEAAVRRRKTETMAPLKSAPSTESKAGVIEGFLSLSSDTVRIRSELLNLLLPAHDSVGIALSEMFYCLARSADSWAKLRDEVEQTLQGRLPTLSDLKGMQYLQWTIKETIRIRPTLSVHGRVAIHDTVLPRGGGACGEDPLYVSKGSYVVYSNYALYRNEGVFGPDVDTFRPERWAQANPATFEYLGFGAGPRRCPGKDVGWSMLAYSAVRLAQEITSLRPEDERPWQEATAFSFHNRHGVHLSVQ